MVVTVGEMAARMTTWRRTTIKGATMMPERRALAGSVSLKEWLFQFEGASGRTEEPRTWG
jgi:hypothetical protein